MWRLSKAPFHHHSTGSSEAGVRNSPMLIACSMGVMAHNEEANIGRLLEVAVAHHSAKVCIREIVVVASGCTDNTEAIVQEWAARDDRVRLISQPRREGKAAAVNEFLASAREKVIVLCSADLLPAENTLEQLVAPFEDPEVGMTTCRPVPINDPSTLMGFAAHMLWGLHHRINSNGSFKAGELIAFRKIFERIPYRTAVDEASVEPVIRGQGYRVHYVGNAVVFNKGPETVEDFLRQRRRIYAGHLSIRDTLGYSVSTLSGRKILGLTLKNLDWRPRALAWTAAIACLEAYGRYLGSVDYKHQRDHTVWEIATTTKELTTGELSAKELAPAASRERAA
jgi:poly-beta-1,6-N-acetyl-D-glucosamine synthase